jgi:hypothetical protein
MALIGLGSVQVTSQAATPAPAKKTITSTAKSNDVTFTCKQVKATPGKFTSTNEKGAEPGSIKLNGRGKLESLLMDIDSRIGGMDEFLYQDIDKQKTYEIMMEYKGNVSIEKVLDVIGPKMGFTYQVKDKKVKTIYETDFSHIKTTLISTSPKTVTTVSSKPSSDCKITKTATGYTFHNARLTDIAAQFAKHYNIVISIYPTTGGSVDILKEVSINTPASLDKGIESLKATTGIELKPKKIQADTIVIIGKKIK